MKYTLISIGLLVVVLLVVAYTMESGGNSSPSRATHSTPSSPSDDNAMKNLKIQ